MVDPDSPIVLEVNDSIAIVRFNQPSQRNPLSLETLRRLELITTDLFARDDVHSVIFTGTADVFASGANIRELQQLQPEDAMEFSRTGQRLFQTIVEAKQLTIAAINGYCMGGALDLALACDIRVSSTAAIFAHPGAQLGIITGWGGTQRLPGIVGRANALELMLTAGRYTAFDALRINLITGLGDPIINYALELARAQKRRWQNIYHLL